MPAFDFLNGRQMERLLAYLYESESEIDSSPTDEPSAPASPYTSTGYNRFVDADGYPAVKPPWGTLNAIDLNKGEILWKVPLGEYPELTARGIPITGTENYGGPVVTAGGGLCLSPPRRMNASGPSTRLPATFFGKRNCPQQVTRRRVSMRSMGSSTLLSRRAGVRLGLSRGMCM